jgi:hypothetical protein
MQERKKKFTEEVAANTKSPDLPFCNSMYSTISYPTKMHTGTSCSIATTTIQEDQEVPSLSL